MMSMENALTVAQDKMDQGLMSLNQANVYIIQLMGVRIIHKLDRVTRNALNVAVKAGELGHLKKDGLKPEAYFHKNSKWRAIEVRNELASDAINNIKNVFCGANITER